MQHGKLELGVAAKDAVDDEVLRLHEAKRRLVDDLRNADDDQVRTLTKAELKRLFS